MTDHNNNPGTCTAIYPADCSYPVEPVNLQGWAGEKESYVRLHLEQQALKSFQASPGQVIRLS